MRVGKNVSLQVVLTKNSFSGWPDVFQLTPCVSECVCVPVGSHKYVLMSSFSQKVDSMTSLITGKNKT